MSIILANWKKRFAVWRYARFGNYWRRFIAPENNNKTLERWKNFARDEQFRKMLQEREVIELSEQLFGEIPGTRELLETINYFSFRLVGRLRLKR